MFGLKFSKSLRYPQILKTNHSTNSAFKILVTFLSFTKVYDQNFYGEGGVVDGEGVAVRDAWSGVVWGGDH